MSLTWHLSNKSSPVFQYFSERVPRIDFCNLLHQAKICGGLDSDELKRSGLKYNAREAWTPKIMPTDAINYPWRSVGMAFDYRLRLFFEAVRPEYLVAGSGVDVLAFYFQASEPKAFEENAEEAFAAWAKSLIGEPPDPHRLPGFDKLAKELTRLVPIGSKTKGLLKDSDERILCRLCYVLALYEQCARAGIVESHWPIVALGYQASLESLMSLCEDRVVDDMMALSRLFLDTGNILTRCKSKVMNPTFAGSLALGGADADFIIDHCLYELKTTKIKPGRKEFLQLVGYVLADYDDRWEIKSVGFYYSRQGLLIKWPLAQYLTILAGKKVSLTEMRNEFKLLMPPMDIRAILNL